MSNEELVKEIQQGINANENLGLLFQQNEWIIKQIIKKYSGIYQVKNTKISVPIIEYQDLLNEAYFGIYEAAQRYEDTAGVKFMSYAQFWIKQCVHRYIENYYRTVRVPVYVQGLIRQYNKVVNAYKSQLSRKPTDKEICIYLNIDFKTLNELKKVIHNLSNIKSLDEPINGEEEDLYLSDIISSGDNLENHVVETMMERSLKTELWQIVKDNTTPEENNVIRHRYIKSMSLEATGNSIGQTRDRVRTIEAKALRKLRQPRIRRKLEEKFEINYARAYNSGFTRWKDHVWTSIVEDIAIKNYELAEKTN